MDPLSPTSTDTSPDDGGRGAPPLDSQDTGGGTLSESGANSGSATNKAQNLAEAATKVEVGRQEKEVGLLKSACRSLHHNLLLIACYDRNLLLFLNNFGLIYVDLLV